MNKILIAAMAVVMAGCSGAGGKGNGDSDSMAGVVADTVVDTAAVADSVAAAENRSNFLSADLKEAGLLGKVKSVSRVSIKGSNEWMPDEVFINEAMAFGEDGRRSAPKAFPYDIKRDANGFIQEISTDFGASDGSGSELDYKEINEWGWPVKAKVEVRNIPDYDSKGNASYSYPSVDSHGNWTVQKVTMHLEYEDLETGNPRKEDFTLTRSRTIKYYE